MIYYTIMVEIYLEKKNNISGHNPLWPGHLHPLRQSCPPRVCGVSVCYPTHVRHVDTPTQSIGHKQILWTVTQGGHQHQPALQPQHVRYPDQLLQQSQDTTC